MLEVHHGGGANPVASPTNDGTAFPNATMHTTDTRGQWWGPVLWLPKEVRGDEEAQEAQEDVEVW